MKKKTGNKMMSANKRIGKKIISAKEFVAQAKKLKTNGKKLVQCDGVFDLIHPGHIESFAFAKKHGDILYVVLVADKFVRKGPGRPMFDEATRAAWVASFESVDYVIVNKDFGPNKLIRIAQPDFLVKGEDYIKKPTPGFLNDKKCVEAYGGRVVHAPVLTHSTDILSKIYKNF